jgi:hypothetical protein
MTIEVEVVVEIGEEDDDDEDDAVDGEEGNGFVLTSSSSGREACTLVGIGVAAGIGTTGTCVSCCTRFGRLARKDSLSSRSWVVRSIIPSSNHFQVNGRKNAIDSSSCGVLGKNMFLRMYKIDLLGFNLPSTEKWF